MPGLWMSSISCKCESLWVCVPRKITNFTTTVQLHDICAMSFDMNESPN